MATTQISNIYEPLPFDDYIKLGILNQNKFLMSGLMVNSPVLSSLASQGGRIFELPFWNPIATGEPNYSTDTTATSTAKNITAGTMTAVRHTVNSSWSSMDLTSAVAGSTGGDPLDAIGNDVTDYWNTDISSRISASLKGIIADNIANDDSDMVEDIAVDIVGSQTDLTKFNSDSAIDAMATMGDKLGALGAMICHSVVYTKMQKLNVIDFVPSSDAKVDIPTYMGKRVFVDNETTVVAGSTSGYKYYTYFFGAGAFAFGLGTPKTPSALKRDENAGNGEGEETLYSRKQWIIHPEGFDWKVAKGTNPAYATLGLATSWDRLFERKNINIACLISN